MFFSRVSGSVIVLRENHANDFDKTAFTTDGTWRDLDLSSLLPAGTKCFWVKAYCKATTSTQGVRFRKKGNTSESDIFTVVSQAANVPFCDTLGPVSVDNNRFCQYRIDNASWTEISIVIQAYI